MYTHIIFYLFANKWKGDTVLYHMYVCVSMYIYMFETKLKEQID